MQAEEEAEEKDAPTVQQPSNYGELVTVINSRIDPIVRQLERIEERMESRTRDLVTRGDLEALRRDLVARESLEPQLNALRTQIAHVDKDRETLSGRIDQLEAERISKQERLWVRIGQILSIAAFAMAMFEFLSHARFTP